MACPYASELNPAGAVWPNLNLSLANLTERNTEHLTALAETRLGRMPCRPGLLDGFLAKTRSALTTLEDR